VALKALDPSFRWDDGEGYVDDGGGGNLGRLENPSPSQVIRLIPEQAKAITSTTRNTIAFSELPATPVVAAYK
jgi:hypothetical protein